MNERTVSIPTMLLIIVLIGLLNEATMAVSAVIIFSAIAAVTLIIVANLIGKATVIVVTITCIAWLIYCFWWFLLAQFP